MEQQGPTQIPGTPQIPLIYCELPKGPPQTLLHTGILQPPSAPLKQDVMLGTVSSLGTFYKTWEKNTQW